MGDPLERQPHFEVWNEDDGRYVCAGGRVYHRIDEALAVVDWSKAPIRVRTWREGKRPRIVQLLAGVELDGRMLMSRDDERLRAEGRREILERVKADLESLTAAKDSTDAFLRGFEVHRQIVLALLTKHADALAVAAPESK